MPLFFVKKCYLCKKIMEDLGIYHMKEEQKGEIVIYQNDDNSVKINVRLENETIWLTQAQLVELYQSSKSNVNEHIKHIFEEGELNENSVVRKFRTTVFFVQNLSATR